MLFRRILGGLGSKKPELCGHRLFFRPTRRSVDGSRADPRVAEPTLGEIERDARLQRTNPEGMAESTWASAAPGKTALKHHSLDDSPAR